METNPVTLSPTDDRSSALALSLCSPGLCLSEIVCGDNVAVMKTWPDACIDLVVTSPPYDNLRTYGGHTWDFEGVARELTRVLKPGGVIVWVVADATVKGSETLTSMRQAIHFKDVCGLRVHDTMIWCKDNPVPTQHNRYQNAIEYMLVLSKGAPAVFNAIIAVRDSVGARILRAKRLVDKGEYVALPHRDRWEATPTTGDGFEDIGIVSLAPTSDEAGK